MHLVTTVALSPAASRADVLATLRLLGRCRVLVDLLLRAGFEEDLSGSSAPLTIFAPTDAAFAQLAGGHRGLLAPAREEMLIDLLEYHLVRGRLDLDEAVLAGSARTVHGAEVHFREEAGAVRVDAARVRGHGIACPNGVVYLVDGLLSPAWSACGAWIAARLRVPAAPRGRAAVA